MPIFERVLIKDNVVIIKIGAYSWCLFCVGAYYPDFTVSHKELSSVVAANDIDSQVSLC